MTACAQPSVPSDAAPAPTPVNAPEPANEPELDVDEKVLHDGIEVAGASHLNARALTTMRSHAKKYGTSALLVIRDSKIVVEDYFGHKPEAIMAMSATKSFVNLAIGLLIADGKLTRSQQASDFFPAWRNDARDAITLDHLLSHTSGIDPARAFDPQTHAALSLFDAFSVAKLDSPVGATWLYNNNAVDGLSLIAQMAAGKPLADYLNERLLTPIGAKPISFRTFADGAPMGAGEMMIAPIDMAKVGILLANLGQVGTTQIIDPAWINASLAPSFKPDCGQLWWRNVNVSSYALEADTVDYWKTHGVDAAIIGKLGGLIGTPYPTYADAADAVFARLTKEESVALNTALSVAHFPSIRAHEVGPMRGYFANGWLGQYLFVVPDERIVAVRMHKATSADYGSNPPSTEFREFPTDVLALFE